MPRNDFDISDGGLTVDRTGTDHPSAPAACDAAIKALPDVARNEMAKARATRF